LEPTKTIFPSEGFLNSFEFVLGIQLIELFCLFTKERQAEWEEVELGGFGSHKQNGHLWVSKDGLKQRILTPYLKSLISIEGVIGGIM